MQDLSPPAGRVVAVSGGGRGIGRHACPALERGPADVSILVEGFPVGDLPVGARLRIGETAIVELLEPDAAGQRRAAPRRARLGRCRAAWWKRVRPTPFRPTCSSPGSVGPETRVALEASPFRSTDVLDLHSFRPEETSRVVSEYLDEARRAGVGEVRIIHGRGRGVQRAIIRRLLAEAPGVAGFADAPPTRGGWGATVVRLHRAEDAPSA